MSSFPSLLTIAVDLGVFFMTVHVYQQVLDHSPLVATAFGPLASPSWA